MRVSFAILVATLMFTGCSKYPPDSVTTEENDMIGSLYDQSADFSSYKTFAIVDTVLSIRREDGKPIPDTSVSRFNDRIIKQIADGMIVKGYTRVSKDSTPDLGIDVSIIVDENIGSYTYWGGYPGYWGWYGYSYWYSYPTTTYYRYEQGTLVMNMIDIKNKDDVSKELPVIWNNIAAGLVSDNVNYNYSRIERAINTMFEQSPYVKR